MEMLLQEHYPSAWRAGSARAIVLPNAFMTEVAAGPSQTSGDLVLGHLSNLTEDKGALRFLNLFAKLRRKGLAVRAHIAGPAKEPKIRDAITALATEFPDAFRWFGPVYGVEKETFYEGVDVFVFPSAYANEAQPLVLLEALAQGAAVLTTDRGCMGCDHSGSPGAVFNETDFDVEAERWIVNFAADFDRKIAARTATTRFLSLKQEADYALRKVLSTI
jgi:glycosyltransferase involved in cell wall biosynthesis